MYSAVSSNSRSAAASSSFAQLFRCGMRLLSASSRCATAFDDDARLCFLPAAPSRRRRSECLRIPFLFLRPLTLITELPICWSNTMLVAIGFAEMKDRNKWPPGNKMGGSATRSTLMELDSVQIALCILFNHETTTHRKEGKERGLVQMCNSVAALGLKISSKKLNLRKHDVSPTTRHVGTRNIHVPQLSKDSVTPKSYCYSYLAISRHPTKRLVCNGAPCYVHVGASACLLPPVTLLPRRCRSSTRTDGPHRIRMCIYKICNGLQ